MNYKLAKIKIGTFLINGLKKLINGTLYFMHLVGCFCCYYDIRYTYLYYKRIQNQQQLEHLYFNRMKKNTVGTYRISRNTNPTRLSLVSCRHFCTYKSTVVLTCYTFWHDDTVGQYTLSSIKSNIALYRLYIYLDIGYIIFGLYWTPKTYIIST